MSDTATITLRDGDLVDRVDLLRQMIHRGVFCEGIRLGEAIDVEDLLGEVLVALRPTAS